MTPKFDKRVNYYLEQFDFFEKANHVKFEESRFQTTLKISQLFQKIMFVKEVLLFMANVGTRNMVVLRLFFEIRTLNRVPV